MDEVAPPPSVAIALIVALPVLMARTVPFTTAATSGFEDIHCKLLFLASFGLIVAEIFAVEPSCIESVKGLNVISATGLFDKSGFLLISP